MGRVPRLRTGLEFARSTSSSQPGIVLSDPMAYTDRSLIIPPALIPGLRLFDGTHTTPRLQSILSKQVGFSVPRAAIEQRVDTLARCGFLETPEYASMRARRVAAYEQWNIDPRSVVTFCALEFRHSHVEHAQT